MFYNFKLFYFICRRFKEHTEQRRNITYAQQVPWLALRLWKRSAMDFAQLQERGGGRHAANALGWIQPGELYWHPIFFAHFNLTLDWYVQNSLHHQGIKWGKFLFFFHYLGNIKKTKKRREGEKRPEPVTVVGGVTKKPSTKLSTVIITTDQIPVVLSKWRGD